jgi:transcriptional regulator with XRE-family HTH domain
VDIHTTTLRNHPHGSATQNLRTKPAKGPPRLRPSLAAATKIDRTYISGIERGVRNPSLDYIERLAEALGVDAGELVGTREGEAG